MKSEVKNIKKGEKMGWKTLIISFLLSFSLVSGELFLFYDENVYTVKKIFDPYLHEAVFSPSYNLQPDAVGSKGITKTETEKDIVEITITEKGFLPGKIKVKRNQTVIWRNEREKLPALILGVREISGIKKSLQHGESFSYSFSKPGKYFYVDGIVIGYKGEVEVLR